MPLSKEHFENGWGYKLNLAKNYIGFVLFLPSSTGVFAKKMGFSPTKFAYKHYKMWVVVCKGRRAVDIEGFLKRNGLTLLLEDDIIERCYPFPL
jgi:hypothetical protein